MGDVYSTEFSETDADNDSSSGAGWPEGMAPSRVNDAARALQGAVKRFVDQHCPKATTGSTTAYVLTYDVAPGSLADGMCFLVNFDQACGASPTLNVNSLGAKTLQKYVGSSWSDLAAGDIQADQILRVAYNSTSGKFRVISPLNSVPTGTTVGFRGTSSDVPDGWVIENGGTIGDASSGATNLAAASAEALFLLLWGNSNYTLQDSSGTATTKGATAAADWAAHKRLVLLDMADKYRRGNDTTGGGTGGSTSISSGTTSGSLTVSGSTQNVNVLSVNVSQTGQNLQSGSSSFTIANSGTYFINSGTLTVSGSATGSLTVTGTATPPYVYELSIIKL